MMKCCKFQLLVFLLFFGCSYIASGQGSDAQLAQYYYNKGDFEKATPFYESLYKNSEQDAFFLKLVDCYKATERFRDAERLIKKQWSNHKYKLDYPILLAQFYEETGESNKANGIYKDLINDLEARPSSVITLFNLFKGVGKNELAYQTIVKGRDMLKDSYPLHFQFAEYYGATGQTDKMLHEYLGLLDYNPTYASTIQTILSRQIDFENTSSKEYVQLKSALLQRAQKNPDDLTSSEMVIWFFVQSKEFGAALMQEEALDRRLSLNGVKVFNLGIMCVQNHEYATARRAFQYVITLGEQTGMYHRAENALLNTRFLEITTVRGYSNEEIDQAIGEYQSALDRMGRSHLTLPLILEQAHIMAFYGNRAQDAIESLTNALTIERTTAIQQAEIKMELADIQVLHGDIWEASLYYMQIDKAFKFEPIGQEARFKNARIFYYDGEFDYAQSQLDVLKQGTTKLISNDAIELSILITDNYGLDSNYTAMFWFASADLFIEQHKYVQAFQLFDSIMINFPYHSLGDEILMKKSKAMQQQGNWQEALQYLDQLLKNYSTDILADDAFFEKGTIYQNHLFDNEKAMENYKELMLQFPGSILTPEARKRFRQLREGEDVPNTEVN